MSKTSSPLSLVLNGLPSIAVRSIIWIAPLLGSKISMLELIWFGSLKSRPPMIATRPLASSNRVGYQRPPAMRPTLRHSLRFQS